MFWDRTDVYAPAKDRSDEKYSPRIRLLIALLGGVGGWVLALGLAWFVVAALAR